MTGSPITNTSQSQKRKTSYVIYPNLGAIALVLVWKINPADGGISL
jgi:hypothetical protein